MKQSILLLELKELVLEHIQTAESFRKLDNEQLNFKETQDKWSVLECMEHLNLYGDFYLVEIEKRMLAFNGKAGNNQDFKSGWLGNYFASSMLPPEDGSKMKTMKTFKDKEPESSQLPITTIDRFIKQQKRMLQLLEMAEKVDLNKVKTNITILKGIIRLKLGDTVRFVIYHNLRHMLQAEKCIQDMILNS